MKIVIIGAGIAGCAAYLELKKHLPTHSPDENHEILIYEAYSTELTVTAEQREPCQTHSSTLLVGGGLGIAPNGLRVLQRIDEKLVQRITRGGYVISHSNLKDKNGNVLMRMGHNNLHAGPAPEMLTVASSRHLLWKALRERIPDEHIIQKRIIGVVANAEGRNLVRFADGSDPVEADLIIGADGVRSIAKRSLFPESKEDPFPPQYEGLVGVGGFVPAAEVQEFVERGSMNFVFGGAGFFGYFFNDSLPSEPHHQTMPDRKTLDMDDVSRQLKERHVNWKDPVVQKIIQSVEIRNMYPTWTSPPLPNWEKDGVVLVGDAAHALPSTSGQGASQALEDCEAFALFLSHHLRKVAQRDGNPPDPMCAKHVIKTAASRYYKLRQPRVKEILEAAQKIQNSKRNMGAIQEYAMYSFMKLFGLFPSFAMKSIRKVNDYDIAKEVLQVITMSS